MDQNEEYLAFNYVLGMAIRQWAHIEFALSWIVGDVTKSEPAVAGFRSIENFRSKLQYVDSVLTSNGMSTSDAADWADLMERTRQASIKRNKLVHYWSLTNTQEERPGRKMMLLPMRPALSAKKPRGQKYHGAIYLRDIAGHCLEFSALMQALENFCARLCGRQEPFPKSQEQPRHPPTIAEIRRELYAYASHPPRPLRA